MQKPKLRKLADKIYCLEFNNAYDLSMTFLRYQEYYESPKFREKFFTISDFMEWYSKKYGDGAFTYPTDYVGFNLPSHVIIPVLKELRTSEYDMWTPYDDLMYSTVLKIISQQHQDNKFYLIGVMNPKEDQQTLRHELAHALFSTNSEYQRTMGKLINKLPEQIWRTMKKKLKGRGYANNVYDDEAQAYLATGLHFTMTSKSMKRAAKPFRKVFEPFRKNIL